MVFEDRNGERIRGSSLHEVVEDLRNGSFFGSEESLEEYMQGFAERTFAYSNHTVRTDSIENFVNDLVAAGYWKRIE